MTKIFRTSGIEDLGFDIFIDGRAVKTADFRGYGKDRPYAEVEFRGVITQIQYVGAVRFNQIVAEAIKELKDAGWLENEVDYFD